MTKDTSKKIKGHHFLKSRASQRRQGLGSTSCRCLPLIDRSFALFVAFRYVPLFAANGSTVFRYLPLSVSLFVAICLLAVSLLAAICR